MIPKEQPGGSDNVNLPYSIFFDGASSSPGHLNMGTGSELQFERTDSFSFAFWIKTTDGTTNGSLFGNLDAAPENEGYELGMISGELSILLASDIGGSDYLHVRSSTTIHDGFWHHIIVTYDGSSTAAGVNMYEDGALMGMTTEQDTLTASIVSTQPVWLGARASSEAANVECTIAEFAVYGKVLDAGERTAVSSPKKLNLNTTGPIADLAGYWRMGNGIEDVFNTIADNSASGNDGTMTNMDTNDVVMETPWPGLY